MNHSEGPTKVQKAEGKTRFGMGESNDMLYLLKNSLPQLFDFGTNSKLLYISFIEIA